MKIYVRPIPNSWRIKNLTEFIKQMLRLDEVAGLEIVKEMETADTIVTFSIKEKGMYVEQFPDKNVYAISRIKGGTEYRVI